MLHRLQVTINLHKSKLYVSTMQKFSKDINFFASKVDKRKIVEVNGEWKLYKENEEKSTLPLKEAMLTVSSLWFTAGENDLAHSLLFTVSGKI